MGFLEGLLKQVTGGQDDTSGNAGGLGGLASLVSKNPKILAAMAGLLSSRDSSIGGSGGLGGLVGAFEKKGLGSMITSWISTGPNPAISTTQVKDVLGDETIEQFAGKAGVSKMEAGPLLAGLLPTLIDRLTPDGKLPDTNALEGLLSSLKSEVGR